jgi:hypothetical protein
MMRCSLISWANSMGISSLLEEDMTPNVSSLNRIHRNSVTHHNHRIDKLWYQKEGGHERIQDTELTQVLVRPLSPPQLYSFWDNHLQLLS